MNDLEEEQPSAMEGIETSCDTASANEPGVLTPMEVGADPYAEPCADHSVVYCADPCAEAFVVPCADPRVVPYADPCVISCVVSCVVNCADPCVVNCADPCVVSCVVPCEDPCVVPCADTCVDPCAVPCEDPCVVPCADTCVDPCAVPCEDPCVDLCAVPCDEPCEDPCVVPRADPCVVPCADPCEDPCVDSCAVPCDDPCVVSRADPCVVPCADPCEDPCVVPRTDPCGVPRVDPCVDPCAVPCDDPCDDPCVVPRADPCVVPFADPCEDPCVVPRADPCVDPCAVPCENPCEDPCAVPREDPCEDPCVVPCEDPCAVPCSALYPVACAARYAADLELALARVTDTLAALVQRSLAPTRSRAQAEIEAISHLLRTFKSSYPLAQLHVFGSSFHKHAFLDSAVELRLSGHRDSDSKTDQRDHLATIAHVDKLLRRRDAPFKLVTSGVRVRWPSVTILHTPTGLLLNLSAASKTVLAMSQLLGFYLAREPRFQPVLLAVKYWARLHNVCNGNRVGDTTSLSTHALTMMVVFYLQRKTVLPAVCKLQDAAAANCSSRVLVENGWLLSIDKSYAHSTSNSASVAELFAGFFDFYADYPFGQQVICPYLGCSVQRDHFRRLATIPESLTALRTNCLTGLSSGFSVHHLIEICVQDPLLHDDNITAEVSLGNFRDMLAMMRLSARVCALAPELWLPGVLSPKLLGEARAVTGLFAVVQLRPLRVESVLRIRPAPAAWVSRRLSMLLCVLEEVVQVRVARVEFKSGYNGEQTELVADRVGISCWCIAQHPPLHWLCEGHVDVIGDRKRAAKAVRERSPQLFDEETSPLTQQAAVTEYMMGKNAKPGQAHAAVAFKVTINIELSKSGPAIFLDLYNRHSAPAAVEKWKKFFLGELSDLVEGAVAFEDSKLSDREEVYSGASSECTGCMGCRVEQVDDSLPEDSTTGDSPMDGSLTDGSGEFLIDEFLMDDFLTDEFLTEESQAEESQADESQAEEYLAEESQAEEYLAEESQVEESPAEVSLTDESFTDISGTDLSFTDISFTDRSLSDVSFSDVTLTDESLMDLSLTDESLMDVTLSDESLSVESSVESSMDDFLAEESFTDESFTGDSLTGGSMTDESLIEESQTDEYDDSSIYSSDMDL